MANSVITKTALAKALKELMGEKPFAKISVAEIADKCRINRKSFYYHFKDKHDLVNWIFESEFVSKVRENGGICFEMLGDLCRYFYDNKDFYRKVLKTDDSDSFSQHFRQLMMPAVADRVKKTVGKSEMSDMYAGLSADILICTIKRWLFENNCIEPEKFVRYLKEGALRTAAFISGEAGMQKS